MNKKGHMYGSHHQQCSFERLQRERRTAVLWQASILNEKVYLSVKPLLHHLPLNPGCLSSGSIFTFRLMEHYCQSKVRYLTLVGCWFNVLCIFVGNFISSTFQFFQCISVNKHYIYTRRWHYISVCCIFFKQISFSRTILHIFAQNCQYCQFNSYIY